MQLKRNSISKRIKKNQKNKNQIMDELKTNQKKMKNITNSN